MPASDLALLLDAARAAGDIALHFFDEGARRWEKPNGQGLVTEADLAVDAYLFERLIAERPEYGWLSEETHDDIARLDAERTFVVDPIDGTRSFAERDRTWAISLAVVENGRPIAAVIHLPARKLTYTALRGEGALLNGEVALFATKTSDLNDATILANRVTMEPSNWPGGVPPVKRDFRSSLAYRIALVAEGRYDAMVTFRETWDWDIAAGVLIAEEAGAIVTNGQGRPISLNSAKRQNAGIIAASPEIHAEMLALRTA